MADMKVLPPPRVDNDYGLPSNADSTPASNAITTTGKPKGRPKDDMRYNAVIKASTGQPKDDIH
jgi:hypothetical protein